MVSIGTLSWKVQVEKAAEAKDKAKDVAEKVQDAKESMDGADESTEGLKDKFGGLADVQDTVGKGFDKVNAKAGFAGTALKFVQGTVGTLMATLGGVTGLILGGGLIAAVIALATAFKDNIGNIQGKTDELLKDLESLTGSGIEGFSKAMKGLGGALSIGIGWIGDIIDVIADLNEQFGFIEPIIQTIVTLFGAFAIAWTIVQVITAIISVAISFIGILGGVMSSFAGIISAVGTFISVMGTIISVVGTVIAALNPITLAILAIVAVIATLYAAWKTNFLGIRDITDDVISKATELVKGFVSFVKSIPQVVGDVFNGLGSGIASGFKDSFNSLIPSNIPVPSITIGKGVPGPDYTIGGGSLDIPRLKSGGLVQEGGLAEIHKGEAVVPADVTRNMGLNKKGGEKGLNKTEIDIGGIEIGDQALDLSKMNRNDLRKLAELIANQLGDKVSLQ